MLSRYATKEMKLIWSDAAKYQSWLLVEIYSVEAYKKHNSKITQTDISNLWKKVEIDIDRIRELELETKHDVIAFTRQISETLGKEKRWVHYGLTSTDVVDTAKSYVLRQANKLILSALKKVIRTLKIFARKYKLTYQIGRTHGVHAEVTTFGYKLALWYDEMNRNLERFVAASKNIEVAKISGAVGNYSNVPLDVQEYVAKKLKLNSSKISSQTLQRDRHAEYISVLAIIGSSLDKFATEIRHLQRTEVREVQESFAKGQKGSSAMPHKQNPISSENISGLSRLLRGFVTTSLENIALWHERDISHSSNERIILPDATSVLEYMLIRFNDVLIGMVVDKQRMLENINSTYGVIFSQRVMLHLIDNKKYSREKAYDIIQPIAQQAFNYKTNMQEILLDRKILTREEVKEVFNMKSYVKNIDGVFKRVGII